MLVVPGFPRTLAKDAVVRRCGDHATPTRGENSSSSIGASVLRNPRISRIENARRRARKHHRLRTRHESRNLVIFFRPWRDTVPAETVIQCQVRTHMPAVLRKQPNIFVARIKRIELALVVLAGHANQEIRKVHAGFRAAKNKTPVELRDRMRIHLVGMKFCAELHGVIAQHL